jgi:hypothetical protein
MTETRGRSARWNTALVLVPGTAAMFGASVAWAASSAPHVPTAKPTLTTPAPVPTVDAQALADHKELADQIAAHRRQVRALARRLAVLRARSAKVGVGSRTVVVPVAPVAPVQQPVVAVAPPPPPPPPPPVNANTGASGAP